RFGFTSDTQDVWGSVAATGGSLPSLRDIEGLLPSFRGCILQIPPMVSALKRDGVRLYDLARQGIEIEREPRPVTVYSLELMEYNPQKGELTLNCHCSKGTYIRTICADLGERLGCGAIMIALRRTMAAGFTLEQCITLDEARELADKGMLENRLIPVESIFEEYDSLTVSPAQASRFQNGGSLFLDRLNRSVSDITKVYSPDNEFIGLGKPEDGELKILRLL
ncbi:MAG: tRNA pseudouridine(55) synthase TruB, partial [Oscillospiraceae bacterium]|nr:tRNA pseudouridine(55) synthase TruB [Oscillospiraceae bacterium]